MKNVREVSLVRIPTTPWLLEYSRGNPMRAELSSESLMILPFVKLENIPLDACDRDGVFRLVFPALPSTLVVESKMAEKSSSP